MKDAREEKRVVNRAKCTAVNARWKNEAHEEARRYERMHHGNVQQDIQHSAIYFVQSAVNSSFRRLRSARLDTAIVSRVFPRWAVKRVAQATGLSSLRRARERIIIECNFHFQSSYGHA